LSQASSAGHGEGQAYLDDESVAQQWAKLPNCSTVYQGSSITKASMMNPFPKDFKQRDCAMFGWNLYDGGL